MKTVLFIIDMQNDFCQPSGSLYIPGAEKDAERLANFISREAKAIDHIILTQDNHQIMDIAHPAFWTNSKGENPAFFTNITAKEVEDGTWIPAFSKAEVEKYLRELLIQGEYPHTIWPEHCLWGSEGAAITPAIFQEVVNWARRGRFFDIVSKGSHPLTEHFGAFRANIPIPEFPETQMNTALIRRLQNFDRILITGEAKSHCVANTIKQMFDYPELIQKLIILNDCMSPVPGCETLADAIYAEARNMGAIVKITTDKTF